MWVANMCFERKQGLNKEFIPCGKLWHNGNSGFYRCALIPVVSAGEHGITIFGNAFKNIEAPYIKGNIVIEGNYLPDSTIKKKWRCGYIYTDCNAVHEVQYIITIFADPSPVFSSRKAGQETGRYGEGIILNIEEE